MCGKRAHYYIRIMLKYVSISYYIQLIYELFYAFSYTRVSLVPLEFEKPWHWIVQLYFYSPVATKKYMKRLNSCRCNFFFSFASFCILSVRNLLFLCIMWICTTDKENKTMLAIWSMRRYICRILLLFPCPHNNLKHNFSKSKLIEKR